MPGILPPNEPSNVCDMGCIREKRLTGPLIPHLWYKGIAVIFLFSAFYFFSKWEGALSREEITGWLENPSVKAFCCGFFVVVLSWSLKCYLSIFSNDRHGFFVFSGRKKETHIFRKCILTRERSRLVLFIKILNTVKKRILVNCRTVNSAWDYTVTLTVSEKNNKNFKYQMEQGIIELKTHDNMWITFMKKLSWSYTFNNSNQMANFCTTLQGKFYLCIPFWELRSLSPNFHIHVSVSYLYIPSWKYINLSPIYECRNWETEYYNSVLEIKVSFLGKFKWKPDIHLQCIPDILRFLWM